MNAVSELTGAAGHSMIDAPVSGGVGGAEAGTLTFMVGSKRTEHFEAAKPLLEAMGKNLVPCGGAGAGQAAKVANNLVLGISMAAVAEGCVGWGGSVLPALRIATDT